MIFFQLYGVWNKKHLNGCELLNRGLICPMEELRNESDDDDINDVDENDDDDDDDDYDDDDDDSDSAT